MSKLPTSVISLGLRTLSCCCRICRLYSSDLSRLLSGHNIVLPLSCKSIIVIVIVNKCVIVINGNSNIDNTNNYTVINISINIYLSILFMLLSRLSANAFVSIN